MDLLPIPNTEETLFAPANARTCVIIIGVSPGTTCMFDDIEFKLDTNQSNGGGDGTSGAMPGIPLLLLED